MGTSVIKSRLNYLIVTRGGDLYDAPRLIYLETDHGIALLAYYDDNDFHHFIMKGAIVSNEVICQLDNGLLNCLDAMEFSSIFLTYNLHTGEILDQSVFYDSEEFMPDMLIENYFIPRKWNNY